MRDGSDLDGGDPGASSFDPDESLLFSFSGFDNAGSIDLDNPDAVTLDAIHFRDVGGSDDFNLDVDGVTVIVDQKPNPTDDNSMRDIWIDIDLAGTLFRIWADGDSDDFRVAGVRITGTAGTHEFDFQGGPSGTIGQEHDFHDTDQVHPRRRVRACVCRCR